MEGEGLGFGGWITAEGRVWRLGPEACCSLWIVNQVLVRFGRAGRLGGFGLGAQAFGRSWQGWSVAGWPGCLTWVLGLRKRRLAPRVNPVAAFKTFECVLSEGLAVAWGCLPLERWMVPVHGGAWV